MKPYSIFRTLGLVVCLGAGCAANSLHKKDLHAVMDEHREYIRRCYENLLLIEPEAQGRIVLEFQSDAQGRVVQSRVANSDFKDSKFQDCIVSVLPKIEVPVDLRGEPIRYPIKFQK